jgi:MFS family permease
MVTLFSLGNVFGRVSCGVAGDFCEARFATPRGAFLILGGLLMCLGAACLAGAPEREGTRNGVALTIGLAEGTIMAAWTSAVRRAFGEKRFGLHLAVYNSALALGSSLFNGFAAAATADESGDYGDGEVLGYKATFAIATTACGGATLLGVAIVKETTRDAALYSGAARRGDDVGG